MLSGPKLIDNEKNACSIALFQTCRGERKIKDGRGESISVSLFSLHAWRRNGRGEGGLCFHVVSPIFTGVSKHVFYATKKRTRASSPRENVI